MKRFRRIVPAATLVLLMLVLATLWLQRVRLMDWLAQRGYTASASVVTLAADDTMTADARHLFFVNRPVIDQAAAFNKACTNKTEKDVVLGCYHGDRQGIYLYDVTDPRLHGVEQVTAAHEMLHQAYDRLSAKERTRINGLLETYAKDGLTDQRIKDKLDAYKQSEPSALDTEMHSIFGTEVRNLPPALEQYYARYFTDRSKIIAFSDGYQAELASRQQQVAAYDQQLKMLATQIDANKATLDTQLSKLSQQKGAADRAAAQHDAAAYQAAAVSYNRMVSTYNQLVDTTKAQIDQYNTIVGERNAIAVEQEQLQQALDSQAQPLNQ